MNAKRFFALLLCLLLTLSLLVSCNKEKYDPNENLGDPEGEDQGPQTVADHLSEMKKVMRDKTFRITSSITISLKDMPDTANTRVTMVTHHQGNNFAVYPTATDTAPIAIYADGVLYAVEAQKKMTMSLSDAKKLFSVGGFDEDWFASFQFKDEWLGFAQGNPVINGKGTDSNGSAYVKVAQSALASFPTSDGTYVNEHTLQGKLTVSSEDFRLVKQGLSYDVEVYTSGATALYHFDTSDTYEYGDGYAVTAPAGASAYKTVTSTKDLTV